jgi:hypothetical protein
LRSFSGSELAEGKAVRWIKTRVSMASQWKVEVVQGGGGKNVGRPHPQSAFRAPLTGDAFSPRGDRRRTRRSLPSPGPQPNMIFFLRKKGGELNVSHALGGLARGRDLLNAC